MKKRLTILVIITILFTSVNSFAQGVFQNSGDKATEPSDTQIGVLASEKPEKPGGPGTGESPVGEGVLILSLLAGGYTILKKRNSRKNDI